MSYLKTIFSNKQLNELLSKTSYLNNVFDIKDIIRDWSNVYIDLIKKNYQNSYRNNDKKLNMFIRQKDDGVKIVWGNCRIPLGACFTKIFEEEGFTFVDDFIWDKGEVQSERHKNGYKPYPFYQYPMNCYEHIFVFHKHRNAIPRDTLVHCVVV